MSFVEKGAPPPDVEEGTILKARIVDIQKVTSKWKDDQGNPKEQLQFDLELENGYKCRSWMAFYERPSDKSKLGKLALKFVEATKKQVPNVDTFLTALKEFGYVFVKCKGFREWEEELYPNFSILTDKIPATPEELEKPKVVQRERAKTDNPIDYLKTVILEVMKPNTMYLRMDLTKFAKVDEWVEDIQTEQAINALLEEGRIRPKFEGLTLKGFTKA